jgi:hypothetical protein
MKSHVTYNTSHQQYTTTLKCLWWLVCGSILVTNATTGTIHFPRLFPKLRCTFAILRMGFNIDDLDRYSRFFNDDSILEWAQSGSYRGPDDIKEFVKFAYPEFTPYMADKIFLSAAQVTVLGINPASKQCEYLGFIEHIYYLNPNTTNPLVPFKSTVMVKLFLDIRKSIITRVNVFYPRGK